MNITKVVFDSSVDTDIARVNRATGVLYLNPQIWDRLTANEREFVLLHENGHLKLQSASEYQANKFAINKFCPVETLTDAELGKRIQVMTEITDPERYVSHLGIDPVSAVADALGGIFTALPMFGIGSKSRIKEEEAEAANKFKLMDLQGKASKAMMITGGMFVVVIIVLYLIFKK